MQATLGISAGTNMIGVVVAIDGDLVQWRTLVFTGKWSKVKLTSIIFSLNRLLSTYPVTQVAVKIPDAIPKSKGYNQLLGSLNILCRRKKIQIDYFTLSELKDFYCPGREISKEMLVEYIVHGSPGLIHLQRKKKTCQLYYMKIFEALAAITCCEAKQSSIQD
jgi:hypothetical protein